MVEVRNMRTTRVGEQRGYTSLYARLWAGLVATLVAQPAWATAELAALVDTALAQNAQIAAIKAQIAALDQQTIRAGAWQEPKLQLAYQNAPVDSLALGVEPMTMVMIRLEQTIPFPGKTGQRQDVARQAAEAKRWELAEWRQGLRAAVATAYYRLALARQLGALTADHVGLVAQLVDAVRIKYEVGRAAQESLLRLEVLRDRLKDDLGDFSAQQRAFTAAINAALHRDAVTPIATPRVLVLNPPTRTAAELQAIAEASRPALKQLGVAVQMHRLAADLALREAFPDATLFAAYGIRSALSADNPGRDLVTFGATLPLPLFYAQRNAAQAAADRDLADAADAQRATLRDDILQQLGQTLATWRRAAEKVRTYREHLVPDAHRVLDATLASYQVDRADLLSLYDAELELLNFEKAIHVATAEGLVAQAATEKIVGRALP